MKDETLASLGTILTKPMSRDAVHIAVVQATCGDEELAPGQQVFLGGGYIATQYWRDKPNGIVDPYLGDPVAKGESFWVFLMPMSITSLKHVWTHPDFPDEMPTHPSGMKFGEAEANLRAYSENWGVTDFVDLLDAIVHHTDTGIPTVDISIQDWSELSPEEYRKFWDSAEVFFGESFGQAHRDETYFRCCA